MIIDLKKISLSKNDKQTFNKLLKRKHNYKSITYIIAWIGFLFGITICGINIFNILLPQNRLTTVYDGVYWKLLFNFFCYFTTQSNILVIIAYLLFLTMFKTKIFNTRNFVLAVGIYINLTMFTYWTVMLPQWIMHELDTYLWWTVFANISFHLVCPILYDIFLLSNVNYPWKKIKNPLNRLHSNTFVRILLIYPICYALCVIIINFTKLPASAFRDDIMNINGQCIYSKLIEGHLYASVYNLITNFNKECYIIKYDGNEARYDDNLCGNILYVFITSPITLILILNIIWILSINNHNSTPREMMKEIYLEHLENETKNTKIYAKYLKSFSKELNSVVRNKRIHSKKHGQK